jgi:hypothetical protein
MLRRSIALIATLSLVFTACGETDTDVAVGGNADNASTANAQNSSTANSNSGTSANSTPNGSPNSTSGAQCTEGDLASCPDRPNAEAIACVAFRCAYQCNEGFADDNGDLASPTGDGCESDCIPTNDGVETCDGLDNNCDGAVDEGFDVGEACTVGEGECAASGVITCRPSGVAECGATAGTPDNETCDGLDNDCDGEVDEGNPGSGGSCSTGDQGQCSQGTEQCQNGSLVCIANLQPAAESCGGDLTGDGVDNDCDGTVDENCADCAENSQIACYDGPAATRGVGACSDGTQTCVNGAFGACSGAQLPSSESCNDVDDDCDGQTDEDFANKGTSCTVGLGVCQAPGVFECAQNGFTTECVPTQPSFAPSAELCDGLDNDCDGQTDEDFTLGARCSVGVGACRSNGQTVCSPSGSTTTCNAVAGTPSTEVCGNFVDDDCDGDIDEDCNCTSTGCPQGQTCCFDSTVMDTICVTNPDPMQLCVL